MKIRHLAAGLALVGLMVMFSTLSAQDVNSPIGAKHVVVIGYDGFGGNYVHWDELPNLSRFKDNGAWTLHKRSVLPSSSAINWATILMGAPSELHGYRDWGSQKPDLPSAYLTENGMFPDIFYLTRKAYPESKIYADYAWDGIGFVFDKTAANEAMFIANEAEICEKGLSWLAENPTLTFIYFHEPDGTGHGGGWGTPEYYQSLKNNDAYLGRILDYLEANDRMKDTVVLFISDHGGIEKRHGGETMEEMESPFMLMGCGVKQGEMSDVVAGYDIAATIAWILGIDPPQCWRGKPILSAFGK